MAFLKIISGTRAGEQIFLDQPVLRIGRRDGNGLIISDPSVSGSHCEIEKSETGYILRDLGSTNGTRVNGETVTVSGLFRNDVIHVGDVSVIIDGDDISQTRAGDTQKLSRTSIVIPTHSPTVIKAPADLFVQKTNSNRIWIVIIVALLMVIAALLFLFLRKYFFGS
jgi:pSer/pThr/pTyr-binding forkhead associated (FHA) protein